MPPRDARWAYLPVLGAPVLHAPLLSLDLLERWKRPLDGGATFRGRRLLGDNKTWRGAAAMSTGPVLASVLLHRRPWYRKRLPAGLRDAPAPLVGAALGIAVVAGELPNSFLKRQLDIAPGTQSGGPAGVAISVLDQVDWVPLAMLLLRPWHRTTPREAVTILGLVGAIHAQLNVVGYAIGARKSLL